MPDTDMPIEEPASDVIVQGPRQRSIKWGDLMTALAKAQGEIEGAKKDSEAIITGQTKRKYADLASVWTAIRGPLTKNGLAIMQWPRVVANGVEIETIVAHGEQFISDVLWMPCAQMNAQGIGSAITYGRRYALMAVAGVAPEDDDGEGAMDRSGVSGSAGGGRDFRPPGPRRNPGNAQTESLRVDPADRDMVKGNGESQYEADKAKKAVPRDVHGNVHKAAAAEVGNPPTKPAAAEKAKKWVDTAIGTLKLPGQHTESLDAWWKNNETIPPGAKTSPIAWLEAAAPDEHERLVMAFTEARDNAKNMGAA